MPTPAVGVLAAEPPSRAGLRAMARARPLAGVSGWAGPFRCSLWALKLADPSDTAGMNGGRKQKPWKHFQVCNKRPICTFLLQRVRG